MEIFRSTILITLLLIIGSSLFFTFHESISRKQLIITLSTKPRPYTQVFLAVKEENFTQPPKSTPENPQVVLESSNQQELNDWIAKKDKYQRELKQHIHEVCRSFNVNYKLKVMPYKYPVIVDGWHNIFACLNAKVGTTTWMHHFKALIGKNAQLSDKVDVHISIPSVLSRRNFFPHDKSDWVTFLKKHNLFSFSFVRHPFDRIVSAYINKIEDKYYPNADNIQYAESCVREMWEMTNGHINFPNFLKGIIEQKKQGYKSDRHWARFLDTCQYCHLDFDIIGRAETFVEDVQYVVLKGNLTNYIPLEATNLYVQHSSLSEDVAKTKIIGKATNKTLKYFKDYNITKDTIDALYEAYKIDFLLFNYTLDGF